VKLCGRGAVDEQLQYSAVSRSDRTTVMARVSTQLSSSTAKQWQS
jgi:hypothetical protein